MDQALWDERYRAGHRVWSGNPNPHLVSEVGGLPPGRALEVGAGEGADAIWLAERGWTVTALDFSSVALEKARAHAAERGAELANRITWLHADLTRWQAPARAFDLVTLHFMHLTSAERGPVYRGLAAAVAPGGVLLIVGHHPSDLETTARRPRDPDRLFTAEDVARELGDGWEIVAAEARPRPATDPDGNEITIHDAVLVARRAA